MRNWIKEWWEKRTATDRGMPDDKLKFMPTSNLVTLGLARLMEAQDVDDEPLIAELYRRAGAERKAP